MRKIFRVIKGIVKGVRDVAPVPSTDAEKRTQSESSIDHKEVVIEYLAQKLTSRGVMITVIIFAVDQIFSLGFFS